ncbi:MAG: class II aldolase/adducin family protein, partial [Fimbriimonadales bacterium]|nr:class II aldolase/adducin family protein [Fimbriimonadales bacterium]
VPPWALLPMSELELRRHICRVARRLWARGLIGATEGNISCRLGEERLLVTPSGKIKADLVIDDIVLTDLKGRPLQGKNPTSEWALHASIYRHRPDCFAIVHAHPPYATALALAGKTIPDNISPEAGIVLGSVALVPFAIPGTQAMGEAIVPYLSKHKTFLLQNHGAVTLGSDLEGAYCRMETLERVARVYILASLLGGCSPLPPEGTQWLQHFIDQASL